MLHVQQAGFTRQRGCPENVFTLLECASFRYYHQFKSTYILFCDLAKAYDSVWHNGLFYKMIHEFNIPPHFVNIIRQMYSSIQCCVLYEGITSTKLKNNAASIANTNNAIGLALNVFTHEENQLHRSEGVATHEQIEKIHAAQ